MRDFPGGLAEWLENGGELASDAARHGSATGAAATARAVAGAAAPAATNNAAAGVAGRERAWAARAADKLVNERSIAGLLGMWLSVVIGFGLVYWVAERSGRSWLEAANGGMNDGLGGLATAVYFSFVTALSIGYGDVSPVGVARVLAVIEGAAGLLIFGMVISKLVSRRQEALVADTHRISFEQRLGRVRTNLHLVLSDLQRIAAMCADPTVPDDRVRIRVESTVAIFEGELHTIHDLLYRPEQVPEEQALETILAGLAAGLEVLHELLECLPDSGRGSPVLQNSLRQVNASAMEICADCVPRDYAPDLAAWMDRVRDLAERIR